ncbi:MULTISPECIES: MarR family winged helix-turn-helix transcriptional regulator [Nocardia]|uniref:MarR family transcriptional regulator n=2 Tax=Nocardia TaxID=1817 RepID=A0A2T2Z406_9NOCA|nr:MULTISPECIES: MarR family winged helix-turn-helix transcriptional regulator [Nocardia]MBF6243921.1 winged helix-turn-helix transcriptional regulator [Nocardia elegans]MBF6448706.1 winged helix-turn-helix transcriptional regulator [Nocardia elegans]PSR62502.1 MarR family transcriptional regulator [Nocardia nova]
MDDTPARLRGKPSWLVSKTATLAQRRIGEAMSTVGARGYHFSILAALDEFGPASQVAIGQRCRIDRSDMHAMLAELEAQKYVAREPDPDDRRRNLITLTAAGERRLHELDATLTAAQDEIFGELTKAEREHLVKLLTRVLDNRQTQTRGSRPR